MIKPFVTGRLIETKGDMMVANVCVDGRWYSCQAKFDPKQYGAACKVMEHELNDLVRNVRQFGHVPDGRTAKDYFAECAKEISGVA